MSLLVSPDFYLRGDVALEGQGPSVPCHAAIRVPCDGRPVSSGVRKPKATFLAASPRHPAVTSTAVPNEGLLGKQRLPMFGTFNGLLSSEIGDRM